MSEQATEAGPLTVDAAIASLIPPETEETAPEAPEKAAEEPEKPEGETSTPEEAEAEPEEQAEVEEAPEEPEPVAAAEPPAYWSKDAKAVFEAMTPEQQAVVLAQEGPREEITAKVKAEAAASTAAANAELGKVKALSEHLAEFLPKAIEVFQSKWGSDPDWVAYATEFGAEAMTIAKAQHDQDLALLQKTANATAEAQTQARDAYIKAEFATLAEIAPDLADPVEGPKLRTEITKFLIDTGLDAAAVRDISAVEMALARDAKLWREAKAALKAAPPKKPAAPAPKATVRPSAAAGAPNPSKQAANRFAQTRSVDDAVALLLAGKA